MMRSLPILLVLGLLLSIFAVHPVHGQTAKELLDSGQLIVRTRIEPEGPVLVGQKTILWVEILTSTWFTSAPQLPQTLEIPNAVVKMPDTFGSNRTERIGGATYAGQARRYLIYPQGPGQFDTPVVPLTLTVALESGGSSPQLSLEAPAQRFEARRPPGSEGLGLVLAAPGMQFNEQWDPEPGELKVGEAITRTVTVTIDDAVGMLLPPLEMKAVEGVSLYPGKPEINDKSNRGQLTGSRSDSATLVMEVEGTYHLPEVVYHWWDLERSEPGGDPHRGAQPGPGRRAPGREAGGGISRARGDYRGRGWRGRLVDHRPGIGRVYPDPVLRTPVGPSVGRRGRIPAAAGAFRGPVFRALSPGDDDGRSGRDNGRADGLARPRHRFRGNHPPAIRRTVS